jgi:predicted GNAT superfamily acetyltransferase
MVSGCSRQRRVEAGADSRLVKDVPPPPGGQPPAGYAKIHAMKLPDPPAAEPGLATTGEVTLRVLDGAADFRACYELQRLTWGRDFEGAVPPSVLKIIARAGGVVAGAFAAAGNAADGPAAAVGASSRDGAADCTGADSHLVGFVLGLTGVRPAAGPPLPSPAFPGAAAPPAGTSAAPPRPEVFHWSHMLAVHPSVRDLGLGRRLKAFQRELLLSIGVTTMEWTFDPLEARNANLNLNILRAEVAEYVEDMYKGEEGSELARGIGTDRFIVSWRLAGEPVRAAADRGWRTEDAIDERFTGAPQVASADLAAAGGPPLPDERRVAVEVPARIQELKEADPARALAWRLGTRRAFETFLGRGYRVISFFRDATGRCFYGLEAGLP